MLGGHGWFAYLSYDEKQGKPQLTFSLFKRVWLFAQPYQWKIGGLLITIFLITGLSLISPLLYRDLIDNALPNNDLSRLNKLALGMIAIPILNGLIGVVQRRLSAIIGEGVIFDLRSALYNHMQHMSLRFFTQTRTGELMSRLNNDVVGAQRAVTSTLVTLVTNVIALISTMTVMLFLEWRLTLLALAILPFFILPARRIARVLRDIRRKSMEYSAEMNAVMNETLNISGALLVKLFGREKYEINRFQEHAGNVREIGVQSAVISQWFFLGLGMASAVGTAVIFWTGGYLVLQGTFSIGTIVAFGSYLTQLYGPLMALTNAPVELAQSMVSFERVFEALDIPMEIVEIENPVTPNTKDVKGEIKFEQVSFAYENVAHSGLTEVARFTWGGASAAHLKRGKQKEDETTDGQEQKDDISEKWALYDINFTIKPGQLVALVGPSGAGKTTLTYLFPRLYDPTDGAVFLDGTNIRDLSLSSLSETIGMVTQETYLFYDTVRANLLYARPDASDEEMIEAAKAANIHQFIMTLSDGYDTVVGERGYRLSGGERQRIAIARVILKDPRILVLDEATSHLDSLSEALIQEALQRVMIGRTSLVIAHRLSTILAADQILVMENGRLVERGTHQQLLEENGLYTNLYETQFQPTELTELIK